MNKINYLKAFISIFLISILFYNFHLFSKFENIENQLILLLNNQTQIMSDVRNQSSNVSHQLKMFKEEQDWISDIRMVEEIVSIEDGKTMLSFNWQIKEIDKNSGVIFHYKQGESEEYQSVSPIEIENGLFEAKVAVEIQLEPKVYVDASSGIGLEREVQAVIEEKMMKENIQNEISYYVTISNNDVMKNSEIHTKDIGYLGSNYYGTLNGFIDIHGEGYGLSIVMPPTNIIPKVELEEIFLLKYKDNKLMAEEKMTQMEKTDAPNMEVREYKVGFYMNSEEEFDYTKLKIKLLYSDGNIFEKEIY